MTDKVVNEFSLIEEQVKYELELTELTNNFILSYLFKKRNQIGKINNLLLQINKIPLNLKDFMEKQTLIEYGYVDVLKKSNDYYVLKINTNGKYYLLNISKKIYNIKSVTLIKRISLYVLKLIRKLKSFSFKSANLKIKNIMESGIIKLILFLITVITFIIKWEEITKFIKKIININKN